MRVRIGVNAGDVIKEREDFFGHAVTVASRVAAKARGGEVLVTDLVAGLVAGADHLRFGPSREEHLKGIADLQVVRPLLLLS